MKRFLTRTSLLGVVFLIIGYLVYYQLFTGLHFPFFPVILFFFFFITNLVHYYLLGIADKNMARFTARFMGMNFVKMFIYLVFAIVFVLFRRNQATIFLVNFLIIYIAFSILEVYEITRVVKQKK